MLFVEILEMQVYDALVHQCGVGREHHVAWRVRVLGQGHKTAEHVVLQLACAVEVRTGIVFIEEQVLVRRIGDTQVLLVDGIDAFVNEYGLFRCCHIIYVLCFNVLTAQDGWDGRQSVRQESKPQHSDLRRAPCPATRLLH